MFGNEQADRIAKRSLELDVTNINIPKPDLMRILRNNIYQKWQIEFDSITPYKVKSKIELWETSFNNNRKIETTLARLRLNCTRVLHLIPHIEGTFPIYCNCDGSRLSLHHLFFNCSFYINEREELLNQLYNDKKNFDLKNILEDNEKYCKLVIDYLKNIGYLNKI